MKPLRSFVFGAAVLIEMWGHAAHAEDLGTIGPTYAISEPNLLAFIEQRLREKERSGELTRLEAQARARGTEAVTQPKPVTGVRATETARSFYFDPSFTLDRNILDAQGHLLFAAGLRKNPLEVVSLSKHLLFFDARDRRQVARARELIASYQGKVKPILTAGSYLDLMKSWRTPVYYDQQGVLVRRFGITQVPALVSQEGMRLRIDELEVAK
ncbi:type-F conjugative transfer system protein TraW [Sphaerotilus sp.]|uniref:type-F conjugative transfer system protein TraW n=1 Tax=Sphaerotilus sp. TaxID=2093942 RepID=UPI002ACD96A8|nr:type-F conjugative transfer system protein TraW [Sphaerotilus sp.]MDZ7855323.1 type-F conjugative transfer system protein TraW [Sphaerotilus sp.]